MFSWSRDNFLKLSSGTKSSQRCWTVMRKTLFWNFIFSTKEIFLIYSKNLIWVRNQTKPASGKKNLLTVRHITYVSTPLLLEAMPVQSPRKAKEKKSQLSHVSPAGMTKENGQMVLVSRITVGKKGAMRPNTKLCLYFTMITKESCEIKYNGYRKQRHFFLFF